MPGIIANATEAAITATKSPPSPSLNYLQAASAVTTKACILAASAANNSTTSAMNYIVQKDPTGFTRISILRLEAGDMAAWLILGTTLLASYALLCNILRFRRRDELAKKYGYHDRASLAKMTTTEAQEILKTLSELEWPTVYLTSLEFALFKVRARLHSPDIIS